MHVNKVQSSTAIHRPTTNRWMPWNGAVRPPVCSCRSGP